ncbi:carbohydrate ABC transporter permease [Phytohabitans suffuscus]|uniref:Sugar ABC transporter permease n=1 Tax=Phytohabitans suffuscus TaxID=624315 RepID=A0A6F8YS38_9ACTN|nr:carbohydrate ABC transporter permease [Phytohabitans suffuscus]BCB88748.1 sugar ABC transporter permease [Phytohabitans suffuscus]
MSRTTVAPAPTAAAPAPPPTVQEAGRRRRRLAVRDRWYLYVPLLLALAATVLPFAWMVSGAFKPQSEILSGEVRLLPQDGTLRNFRDLFTRVDFGHYLFNSAVVAVAVVLGNLLFCSMLGYALSKLDFPGRRVLFALVMTMLMVPTVVTFVPLFVLVTKMGLANTYGALILPFLATPLGVFIMRQFIAGIPDSLIEAARLDGAGEFRIFFTLVLPLSGPALATLAILQFLSSWNEFLWPLVAAQTEDMYTLPVAIALISASANSVNYGLLLAGATVVVLPVLGLFLLLQRYFVQGISTTGLK